MQKTAFDITRQWHYISRIMICRKHNRKEVRFERLVPAVVQITAWTNQCMIKPRQSRHYYLHGYNNDLHILAVIDTSR